MLNADSCRRRSTFVIVKTGGGKTVIYIMLHLLTNKTIVVFEPLIMLMRDQQRAVLEFKQANIRTCAFI